MTTVLPVVPLRIAMGMQRGMFRQVEKARHRRRRRLASQPIPPGGETALLG